MRWLTIGAPVLAILALSMPFALAAKPKKSAEERFAKLDVNSDKKLSKEEFLGKKTGDAKSKAEMRFTKLDKDKDNSLSFSEFNVSPKKKTK